MASVSSQEAESARLADSVEAAAYRDWFAAAPAAFAQGVGLQSIEVGGATVLAAPTLPAVVFNRVIGFGISQPAHERDLREIEAIYGSAGSRNWWLHWTPSAQPENFPVQLQARGYRLASRKSWAKMVHSVEAISEQSTSLLVRRAAPGEEESLARVISSAFGLPPELVPWLSATAARSRWTSYVACDAGTIVGAGMLFIEGRHAWLGMGGVLPEYRRRGAQRALLALRVREAQAAGCDFIATETGDPVGEEFNPSLQNMERCGFRRVSTRLNFVAP